MTENSILMERYELVMYRIRGIGQECEAVENLATAEKQYFIEISCWAAVMDDLRLWLEEHELTEKSFEEWQKIYAVLYRPLREDYETSCANPAWACRCFGKERGQLLCYVAAEIYQSLALMFMGHWEGLVSLLELFVEIYTACIYGAEENIPVETESIRQMIYWHISDYSDSMVLWRVKEQYVPGFSPVQSIIMAGEFSDLRYLYRFGVYISENEIKTAEYMNSLDQHKIDKIAEAFVSGYFRGFEVNRLSLDNKKYVSVRGSVGFERVFASAAEKFRERGLEPVFFPAATTSLNRRQIGVGYQASSVNLQFEFDHRWDKGIFYDRSLANRHLGALKRAYEACREWMSANGGPACFETFGEAPFVPEMKEECCHLTLRQQKLEQEFVNLQAELGEAYMKPSETSFTIIAFPIPEIGPEYKDIFDEIVKVNTLDNDLYREVQQRIIDVLDKGIYVYVRGKAPNRTGIKVMLRPLKHPQQETLFENCCADVNIPVGEVFTSPALKGTEGLLHVTGVCLNGIFFKDLTLRFADGMVIGYDCANSKDKAANQKLIRDYLLMGRDSLPIGEFAIGTNTTAYAAAEKYHITERLPILIVEKMGPHFALGDTCYSRTEDHAVYNPDGKEIAARENEISARRKEEGFQAYFNCHTDITIPYDEIGEIFVVTGDETMIPIIQDGRFVLAGTEVLNNPLNKA